MLLLALVSASRCGPLCAHDADRESVFLQDIDCGEFLQTFLPDAISKGAEAHCGPPACLMRPRADWSNLTSIDYSGRVTESMVDAALTDLLSVQVGQFSPCRFVERAAAVFPAVPPGPL